MEISETKSRILHKSIPIPIPSVNKSENSDNIRINNLFKYELNRANFSPNNASPSNSWNSRLQRRIYIYKS